MKHLLVRTECDPDKPDLYISLCAYRSENKKEFTDTLTKTTCPHCLATL